MCEREHTRTHVWRCAALMLGDRPKSSRGCLLKTAERGEQLSMAVGHSLTLQSAVDSPPPQDDNSKASLILCVWHTSLILGQIRFQPLSSSPFRFPLFLFFCLFYTHVIHSHELLGFGGCRTGDVDSEKNVHSLFRMIDIRKERKLSDILCVHLCSSPQQKNKQEKKTWSVSPTSLIFFLSFSFFFLHALQTNTML